MKFKFGGYNLSGSLGNVDNLRL